jgi:hypothetical protein
MTHIELLYKENTWVCTELSTENGDNFKCQKAIGKSHKPSIARGIGKVQKSVLINRRRSKNNYPQDVNVL